MIHFQNNISNLFLPNSVMLDPMYNHATVNNHSCLHSVILLLALHLCLFTMIGMLLFAKTEVCGCAYLLGRGGTS